MEGRQHTSLESEVSRYISCGYPVTPVGRTSGKIPILKNWQNTTCELSKTYLEKGVFRNDNVSGASFVIPQNILVIDVDNHGNFKGEASLKKISEDLNYDFITEAIFKVYTAGDNTGLHLYFKIPQEFLNKNISKAIKGYDGLEFKTKGTAVIIPHSVLPNGKEYRHHITNTLDGIVEAPKVLMDLISKNKVKVNHVEDEGVRDADIDIQAYKEILETDKENEHFEGNRRNNIYSLACLAKDYGITIEKATELLDKHNKEVNNPVLGMDDMDHTIKSAYSYCKSKTPDKSVANDFAKPPNIETASSKDVENQQKYFEETNWMQKLFRTGKEGEGAISRTNFAIQNTTLFLENLKEFKGRIGYCEFSKSEVWLEPPDWGKKYHRKIDDRDCTNILKVLNANNYDPLMKDVIEAIRRVALENKFHPVKQYFNSLPKWDGVERLKTFFPKYCLTKDTLFTQEIGVKIFTAIVSRVLSPGCKFDHTLVLVGKQGIAKSAMMKALAIKDEWFSDSFVGNIKDKDTILNMQGKLVIESPELLLLERHSNNKLKAFLTQQVDTIRMFYDKKPSHLPRSFIIVATTNDDTFLEDETGARRFWPLQAGDDMSMKNVDAFKEVISLFYAEALYRYEQGEALFLEKKHIETEALGQQRERYKTDAWEEQIAEYLENNDLTKITSKKIWCELFNEPIARLDRMQQRRIANVLKRLGWQARTIKHNKKAFQGYVKLDKKL